MALSGLKAIHDKNIDGANMDTLMKVIKAVHSVAVNSSSVSEADLTRQRNEQEFFSKLVTPSLRILTEKVTVKSIPAEWVRPDFPHDKKRVILYCHGGGYTCGGLNYARILAAKLAINTGLDVFSFAYRLAPENPYPAAIEDAMRIYDYLMYLGYGAKDVIIAGDSAGGNLALELGLHLRAQRRKLPLAFVLFSPWTDMRMEGSSYTTYKDKDPLLTREYIEAVRGAYGGTFADYNLAEFSPVLGDYTDFPPTLVQVGSNEILRSDSESLVKKIKAAGGKAVLEVYKGGWHVFQQMPTSMSLKAMKQVEAFIQLL